MKLSRTFLTIILCAICGATQAQSTDPNEVKADNTKVNKRDRNPGEPTADKQKMNRLDGELSRKIRRSIVTDKSLSAYAHNIKVISQNGSVTLKGPVRSEEEKLAVEAKAVAIAGSGKIINELSIAPKGDNKS